MATTSPHDRMLRWNDRDLIAAREDERKKATAAVAIERRRLEIKFGIKYQYEVKKAVAAERERCAKLLERWIEDVGASQHGRDLNTLLAEIRKGE